MNETDWRDRLLELKRTQSGLPLVTPDQLRLALVQVHALMVHAPWPIRVIYSRISEADLKAASTKHAYKLEEEETLSWHSGSETNDAAVTAAAVQIRALDLLLDACDPRTATIPSSPGARWSVGDWYVIPSRRRRDLGSREGDTLSYQRRGTLRHRIVPKALDGIPVEIIPMMDLEEGSSSDELRLGAGVFPGFELDWTREDGRFTVQEPVLPDQAEVIARQLSAIADDHVLVWPELTINDDMLEEIAGGLRRRALRAASTPSLVVAGSWHRPISGKNRNVAPILDGAGTLKKQYAKVVPYHDKEIGWEDIQNGDVIVVLVCDRFLASVAICKDFCDLNDTPPWHHLGVDLMLVPSMGEGTTMKSHLLRAKSYRNEADQRAFVVQQVLPRSDGEPVAYVHAAGSEVADDITETRVEDEVFQKSIAWSLRET